MSNKTTIPRVIHYCWFGKNKKPKKVIKCIKSWSKYCPDYKIIEWNEDNFNVNISNYTKEAYSKKRWAFVSDYARCFIINENGGIYLDTDVELIKPLDELLVYKSFFAFEDKEHINTGLGFGSTKGNKILKRLLDDYNDIHFINDGREDTLTCPIRNTKIIKEIIPDLRPNLATDGSIFLSKEYFSPLDYNSKKLAITNKTIGIHWYSASWHTKHEKLIGILRKIIKRQNNE